MDLYCLEDFKIEFDKLKSKKSYRTIEECIKSEDLYKLSLGESKKKIQFDKIVSFRS